MNDATTPSTGAAEGAPPPGVPKPTPVTGRLVMGQLRKLVAAHLVANPGAHTAGEIARALTRSSGAVGNALNSLHARGAADLVSTRPTRYRATATTAIAATATPTRARTAPRMPPPPAPPPATRPATPGAPAAPGAPVPATPSPAAVGGPGRTAPVTVVEPVTRPNGQTYHPRALADLPDVEALRRLRAADIPALLYGPPGTGKTSVIEAAFPDLITITGDGDTAVSDFLGDYTQDPDGGYEFVYGPLVDAMVEGRALLIDDATLISPKVLAVVYPAMDGRRQITIKAYRGETITATDGFYVIAGHNPGVHGAVLTEAMGSRFGAQIKVPSDYDLAVSLKIQSKAVRVARNLALRQEKGEIGWAPQLRELIAFRRLSEVLGLDAAVANLVGIAPEEDRDAVADTVATVFGRRYAPLSLGRQL